MIYFHKAAVCSFYSYFCIKTMMLEKCGLIDVLKKYYTFAGKNHYEKYYLSVFSLNKFML